MSLSAIDTGDGRPAVLLHGQPGTAGDWSAVTIRLREGMRVVAPDRPGYGRTGGAAKGFRANAEAIAALLADLGVESAVLAAHSWATGVALSLARFFPDRVRALVLVAPIAPGVEPGAVDRALAHPVAGAAVSRILFRAAGLALGLAPVRSLAGRLVPALPPEQLRATAADWRGDRVWRSFHVEQRALVTELPLLWGELAAIELPTTILEGARDRISGPAHSQLLLSAMPHAELVRVERAGHMLPQQRPTFVSEAIARSG